MLSAVETTSVSSAAISEPSPASSDGPCQCGFRVSCMLRHRHRHEPIDQFRLAMVSLRVMETLPATHSTLARARAGDEQAFRELTDPYRRELQLHCYRSSGRSRTPRTCVQETLLGGLARTRRTSRGARRCARGSYRIATNRCLNALRDAGRPAGVDRAHAGPARADLIGYSPTPTCCSRASPDESAGSGRALRGAGRRSPGIRRRAAAPAAAAARGARAARRARLSRG